MKANELRIGNVVQVNGVEYKIHSIHSPEPMKDENFSDKFYVGLWNNGLTSYLLSDLEPVPLTREILEDKGFYYDEGSYVLDSELGISLSIDLIGGLCYYFGNLESLWVDILGEIKYLHQLQNLWFDLTGEELL